MIFSIVAKKVFYLVYPHTERNGCNDDRNLSIHELLLNGATIAILQSCVIRLARKAFFPQL